MPIPLPKSYRGALAAINRHWAIYGGWRALRGSVYLHLAIVCTLLFAPEWIEEKWWDQAIDVLPGLIGFSLGGFAIWLAFGDSKFQEKLAGRLPGDSNDETSPYLDTAAAFAHFVIIQAMGLLLAVGCHAHQDTLIALRNWALPLNFVGYLLYMYGITSVLAATYSVFQLAWAFDLHVTDSRTHDDETSGANVDGPPAPPENPS